MGRSLELRQSQACLASGLGEGMPPKHRGIHEIEPRMFVGPCRRMHHLARVATLVLQVAPRSAQTELFEARLERAWFQSQAGGSTVLSPDAPSGVVQYLQDVRSLE